MRKQQIHAIGFPIRLVLISLVPVWLFSLTACLGGPQLIESTEDLQATITEPASLQPTLTNTPSPHPPTPTSTIFPTQKPPKILYEERFEDNVTCFKLNSLNKDIKVGIENEAYSVIVEGNNSLATQCIGGYDNFVMEYDVQVVKGDAHSIVGLQYRNYLRSSYNIYISGSNVLCWDYYNSETNSFRNLAGCWARLPEGLNIHDTFHVRLVVAAEKMAIIINDELVTTVYDRALNYGTFGFFIANNGPGTTEVIIDNILIRELQREDSDVFEVDQIGQ